MALVRRRRALPSSSEEGRGVRLTTSCGVSGMPCCAPLPRTVSVNGTSTPRSWPIRRCASPSTTPPRSAQLQQLRRHPGSRPESPHRRRGRGTYRTYVALRVDEVKYAASLVEIPHPHPQPIGRVDPMVAESTELLPVADVHARTQPLLRPATSVRTDMSWPTGRPGRRWSPRQRVTRAGRCRRPQVKSPFRYAGTEFLQHQTAVRAERIPSAEQPVGSGGDGFDVAGAEHANRGIDRDEALAVIALATALRPGRLPAGRATNRLHQEHDRERQ